NAQRQYGKNVQSSGQRLICSVGAGGGEFGWWGIVKRSHIPRRSAVTAGTVRGRFVALRIERQTVGYFITMRRAEVSVRVGNAIAVGRHFT
ncbi:MAG TPA: hypothetical protein VES88_08935, partial [Gemmatimonadaceae bacterium]|nr:hypothetical protein [Gemmatimonadaceae bacterium]